MKMLHDDSIIPNKVRDELSWYLTRSLAYSSVPLCSFLYFSCLANIALFLLNGYVDLLYNLEFDQVEQFLDKMTIMKCTLYRDMEDFGVLVKKLSLYLLS